MGVFGTPGEALKARRDRKVQVSEIEFADFGQALPIANGQHAIAKFHRAGSPQRLQRAIDCHQRHSQRVAELSRLLGLEHLLERRPHGLSGGEAQRVALGRALSVRPGILCLDEPLNALDDETRREMYQLLGEVQRSTGVTILHVTHNLDEAEQLADRILVLQAGKMVSRKGTL